MDLERQIHHDPILALKYDFVQKIGQGCFGKIYKVRNRQLNIFTALKLQVIDANTKKSMLQNEAKILKTLKGKPFVPEFYSHGQWGLGAYIEIQLLVKDLNSLVQKAFSFQQICSCTARLIQSLCVLHNANILHQDIKPQNIMVNEKGQYVFIDFGISKKIRNPQSANQPQGKRTKGFIGTPRYASIQAHKGLEQSKKDDLQSLMYNIAFLYFKKLPWLSLKVAGNRKIQEIKITKLKTAQGVFQQMGKPFHIAFNYIKKLQINEEPNYKYMISIFKRSHSMIMDPKIKVDSQTGLNQSQKMKIKRADGKKLSLNPNQSYGKYLQLPFLTKQGISQRNQQKQHTLVGKKRSSLNLMGNSMNGSKALSMRAYNQVDEITNDQNEAEQNSMNLKGQDDQQPSVPDISRFFSPLTMKNPFAVHH